MSPTITLLLDLLIAGLLVATIVYAILLNRQLINLRESRSEMEGLIRTFNEATARAEAGIKAMKRAATDSGEGLQKTVERATALRDELQFLIEAADALAQRLAEAPSVMARPSATPVPAVVPNPNLAATGRKASAEPRWVPDLGDVSQDLPRGRGVLSREFASPRPEPRRGAKDEGGADLPRGRGAPTRDDSEPPNVKAKSDPMLRPDLGKSESAKPESTRPEAGRVEPIRRLPSRLEGGERSLMAEDGRPARREGGEGLSRAERELLEAMENRR